MSRTYITESHGLQQSQGLKNLLFTVSPIALMLMSIQENLLIKPTIINSLFPVPGREK